MTTLKIYLLSIISMLVFLAYVYTISHSCTSPAIVYETPAKKQIKSVKIVIYDNGCFDVRQSFGAGGKYILRCV
jgi:hypothetical protein